MSENRFTKSPFEEFPILLNFAEAALVLGLPQDDSISSVSELKAFLGSEDKTADVLGTHSIEGRAVRVWVKGGVLGKRYNIRCKTTAASGRKLEVDAEMTIIQRKS